MDTTMRAKRPPLSGRRRLSGFLAGIALLDIFSISATVVQMMLLSQVIAAVFLTQRTLTQVFPRLLLLVAAMLVHAVLVWIREVAVQRGAIRYKVATRQRLFTHLLQLGPTYVKGEASGELVAALYEGIERLDTYVSRYLPQLSTSILVPLVLVSVIFPLDWISGLLLLITGPLIPLLMILVGNFAQHHIQHQWQALSRMSATLLDAIQGMTTLKFFGRSAAVKAHIEQISDNFRVKTLKMMRVAFLSGAVLEFMVAGAIGLIAVVLGVRLVNHLISFERAFLILLLAPEFYRPLRELGVQHHAGMEGRAATRRIDEILAIPIARSTSLASTVRPADSLTITISELTYTYPGSEQPALENVHLELPVGSCTALIGRSGAGKSTLVNVLLRFLEVQSGQVYVNGIALTDLHADVWRESIALVPQHPFLFAASVRDNLRLARPHASDEEIAHAAELAGAAEFIARLPQGYATLLGERGARLSAGQAQRLAIARAFLKDAPLLILDEPTSNLDPTSEALVRQALEHLMQRRTVLLIAHRATTIASAQQVALLDEGRLVEVGPPATFLRRPELFPRLEHIPAQEEVLS
jgi:ATP-binding cassette, subfamily C, bacterial CydD